jgi:hypothetical protein
LWCAACEPADLLQIVAEESFADSTPSGSEFVLPEAEQPEEPVTDPDEADDGDRVAHAALVTGLAEFMVEFCTRVRRANGKYIEQHVELPLTATVRDTEEGGEDGLSEVTYRNAWEFKESGICADLTWLGCGLDVTAVEEGWRVRAGHGSAAMQLTFEPLGSSYRLIGFEPAT